MPTSTDDPDAADAPDATAADEAAGDTEARPEDVAEVVLTTWVRGFVTNTCKWLDESGKAFERHLHKALHPPGYTTAEVVKDVTDVWTRNLAYLASLFTVPKDPGPTAEAAVDATVEAGPAPAPPEAAPPADAED